MANYKNLTTAQLEEKKRQNSANWTPDAAGDALHAENVAIQRELDSRNGTSSTFNSKTGTWATTPQKTTSTSGVNYGTTDYGTLLKNAMAQDAGYDTVNNLLQARVNKALGTQGLSQYAYDDIYGAAQAYLNQNKPTAQEQFDKYVQQYLTPSRSSVQQAGRWDDIANRLAEAALGLKYDDWTNSDQYGALASRYGYSGRMSMQDVLGQIASRTGGLASSYATTAAQQQYNDYMARLEEAARQMYASERNDALENAQLALKYSDNDYQRYLDDLAQKNNDRSFAYQVLSDALAQSNYQQEWQNTLDRQRVADDQFALKLANTGRTTTGGGTTGDKWASVVDWANRYGADAVEDYIGEHYKELGYSSVSAAKSGWNNYVRTTTGYGATTTPTYADAAAAEQSGGYSDVLADVQTLKQQGYGSTQINNVISAALNSGTITAAQAQLLRRTYIGSR